MKVLWLASWYPDEYEPTNGDFIQRHAKAVSTLMPIDLIHVVQAGKDFGYLNKVILNDDGNLHEAIHYFYFQKTGIAIIDKIRYNNAYLSYYRKIIRQYIQEKGRPDLIHVHVPMKAGIIALKLYKELNIPYIVSEQSSLKDKFNEHSFFFRYYTKKIFREAALVTNVSLAIADVLKQMFYINDVRPIPNVVDINYFNFKSKQENSVFRWLHASTMHPVKNVDKIIQAFKNIGAIRNDWELIICGPINKEYEQLVEQLNLQSKIKFIGSLSYEDVAKQMQQADAFILFSKHENFPCVIVEALCCGLPVVTSNVGGIREAVNESNGILVEPGNTDELQKAIISIMNNPNKFDTETISRKATSKYNYQTIANQFINIYKEVVNLKSFP